LKAFAAPDSGAPSPGLESGRLGLGGRPGRGGPPGGPGQAAGGCSASLTASHGQEGSLWYSSYQPQASEAA